MFFLIPKVQEIILADPGTFSGELEGILGLEASENSVFQKLTSKIGPNSNFATFTKKSKNWNCTKNWLVIGTKPKFSGNAYLIGSNKWWKFQRNWRTFIDNLRWPWMEWPCCENFANCYVWSPSTFLGSSGWSLIERDYIWNVNNVKWITWFCPWKVYNYIF